MALPAAPAPEHTLSVVTRRPVLDRTLRTVGFELVFHDRPGLPQSWPPEFVAGRHPAYVGVGPDLLFADEALMLDPSCVVLELSAGLPVDERLIARVRELRAHGFRLVLSDAGGRSGSEPLLEFVDTVKLDVLRIGHHEALCELRRLEGSGMRMLVEGVDSADAFEVFRDAGFDLFQGLFYERPHLDADTLPVGHGAALGALCELQLHGGDFDALEQVIRRDVALSFRLLRYVNSAFIDLPRTVGSIREALMLLGTRAVRQWAVALVLTGLEARPHALLSTALVRARTCELILAPYDSEHAAQGFTAGLFSLLDAILGVPMLRILDDLPLSPAVAAAITDHEGVAGKALAKAIAFERGEVDSPTLAGHSRAALTIAYNDAVRWADAIL
ncbi:MAG TPA: HDOD domain-containing protein [Solirubrobacteraceae bacterium]|nr:HDOD domain-containing protein [Solirubrobacteraceae bacterium]